RPYLGQIGGVKSGTIARNIAIRLSFAYPGDAFGGGRTMMTKRQKQVLDYLREYIDQHGYAPTLEEIGRHFRLASLATVHKHLRNLQRKRLIKRLPHQS